MIRHWPTDQKIRHLHNPTTCMTAFTHIIYGCVDREVYIRFKKQDWTGLHWRQGIFYVDPRRTTYDAGMMIVLLFEMFGNWQNTRIVYGKIVLYDYTRLRIRLDSISLECSKNKKKNLNENSVEWKPCINRKIKSNELII